MFEAVLLAAFSSRIDPAGLVAAMLLYRLFYVVLPLVAAGLLLLAQGLRRRLSAAWALTLVLSLLKDFDWPEALAAIAGLLALFRREFYRRSRLMDVPASGLVLAATAGAINVRLGGEALKARSEQQAPQGLEIDAQGGDSDSTPGRDPEVSHLRSVVGLVWRSVVVWMLLLALLTLARLLG